MRVSDSVHAHLRDAILSGALAPGDAVPSERELSETLGVNRHAVREALNRLQQARLVHVTQGGATRVLDWRVTGGLEVLLELAVDAGGRIDPALQRDVGEMRASIGVDAARRCAVRGAAPLREEAAALAERLAAGGDLDTRREVNVRLWSLMVDGSGNLAYRLALNTLAAGLVEHPELDELLTPGDAEGDAKRLRALAAALRDGDGDAAAAAARPVLEEPLERLSPPPAPPDRPAPR